MLHCVIFRQAAVAWIYYCTLSSEVTSAPFFPSPVSSFLLADLLNLLVKKDISSTAAKQVSTFLFLLCFGSVAAYSIYVAIL